MKSLQKCKHCHQIFHYFKGCNSLTGKTYVRLLATLAFVYEQHLIALVMETKAPLPRFRHYFHAVPVITSPSQP